MYVPRADHASTLLSIVSTSSRSQSGKLVINDQLNRLQNEVSEIRIYGYYVMDMLVGHILPARRSACVH